MDRKVVEVFSRSKPVEFVNSDSIRAYSEKDGIVSFLNFFMTINEDVSGSKALYTSPNEPYPIFYTISKFLSLRFVPG